MKKFLNSKYFYIIILIVFISLSFLIGSKHEPWADETQAWLIARDTSISELFTKVLHTDGHPALWHLILKFFQFLGLSYEYFYIIPIIFSSLGVGVFLFKSKFPWYIKLLLPFTYFIFYQYTIVARGYCLIFLLLCLLATIWDKKLEKIEIFTIIMILLINAEAYTFMFAGAVFLCVIYELIKKPKEFDKKTYLKIILNFGIIILSFLITILYVYPKSMAGTLKLPFYLSDAFFTNFFSTNAIVKIIISMVIIFYILNFIYKYNLKEFGKLCLFLAPVIIFFIVKCMNYYHVGIVLLITIFTFWIQKRTSDKAVIIFLLLVCIIQIPWSIKTSIDDYKYSYCTADQVADTIKKYDYNDLRILGIGFWTNSVNLYFDENIFYNQYETGFFYFGTENSYFYESFNEYYISICTPEIVVTECHNPLDSNLLFYYNEYIFPSNLYVEGNTVDNTYYLYIRKDIDQNIAN